MNPHHSDRARLQHIRDAIKLIISYVEEDPKRGSRTKDAVLYQLQIIGEACNQLSQGVKAQYKKIPWSDIVGMRHHLVHGYFNIDLKDVWDTVDDDLQPLLDQILKMLENSNIQ